MINRVFFVKDIKQARGIYKLKATKKKKVYLILYHPELSLFRLFLVNTGFFFIRQQPKQEGGMVKIYPSNFGDILDHHHRIQNLISFWFMCISVFALLLLIYSLSGGFR